MFYYLFLGLVLLIPLRNITLKFPIFFGIPGLNITNILYGLAALGVLFATHGKDKSESYRSKITIPLVLYICYFFLEIFQNLDSYSFTYLFTWWKDSFLFMIIPYFFVVRNVKEPKKVFWILLVMCIANIYMADYFWRWVRWMNLDSYANKIKSVNGTFGDIGGCNEWASFFSTYVFVVLTLSKSFTRKWINNGLKILAICNIAVLMFTFSRGGYVAFMGGLVYLLFKAKKYFLILLILMIPVFYTTVLPTAVVERIQMTFDTTDKGNIEDQDVESRLVMWQDSLKMIAESPLFGHGLQSFKYRIWRNPHNQHLNILVQGGIIGYGLFVWVFWACFKDANYLYKNGQDKFSRSFGLGMCATIVSLFLANFFGDRWSYYVITGFFWVLCGLVYVLINNPISAQSNNVVIE